MNKLYVYIAKECENRAQKYLGSLVDTKAAVFFVGENTDIVTLKKEINYAVSNNLDMCCVMFGENEFDSGITMQLGLATKINSTDDVELLIKDFFDGTKKKKGKKKTPIVIIAAIVVVIALALIFIVPKNQEKSEERPQISSEVKNLELDDVYKSALIKAGADSIVVDGEISIEEMEQITALDLSGLGINNLEPLLYATNIVELDLSNNKINDITNLVALGKLEKLNLSGNPINDYKVLDYLKNLKECIK